MKFSLALLVLGLAACEQGPTDAERQQWKDFEVKRYEMWQKADQSAIDNCVKAGGIPVRSEWSGHFSECKEIKK